MQALWQRVQALYREFPSDSKLDDRTENMLSPSARAPKLRGHVAEVRCLVPIAARLAQDLLADDLGYEAVVKGAMVELEACYNCLSSGTEGAPERLAEHCRRFCTLSVSLEDRAEALFHVKPKLHLMQELCEMQASRPALHWTYRDEDFGGSIAQLGKRRGGNKSPAGLGRQI